MRASRLSLLFGASVLVSAGGLLTFPQVQEALAARGLPSNADRPRAVALATTVDLSKLPAPEAPGTEAAPEEQDPDPDPKTEPPPPPKGPELYVAHKEVWVYAQPSFRSRKIGYLRAGTTVSRDEKAAGYGSCEKGFYRIAPRGYVCVGHGATLEVDEKAKAIHRAPDRTAGLPYPYALSRFPTPPLYVKLPSKREQASVELELSKMKPKNDGWELGPVPDGISEGVLPSLGPNPRGASLYTGRAVPKSGFALLAAFEWEGRPFGLTTDFLAIPLDHTKRIVPSAFHGVDIADVGLPAAFVRSKTARYYVRDDKTGQMADAGPVAFREGVRLSGKREHDFVELRDGRFIESGDHLVRLDAPREWPAFAEAGQKWVDVSILKQSLVAWEGKKPVYATLVSTGADGLGDPEETHSTIRGSFLVHTKHVTVTMDNDEEDDKFDLRDVPYVQYFHEGYALHAAYWHDDFGRPRSHGCINLHPTDAAWLFAWTTPDVPEGWHAAMSLKTGTTVYVHPLAGC